MDELVEKQREHFNKISERYHSARSGANHLLVKDLIWRHFFARQSGLEGRVHRVLEPMCGMAEGYEILRKHVSEAFTYDGFDYSESMVELAKAHRPGLNLAHGDVTTYRTSGEPYDTIILIGGLHHVYSRAREVVGNLRDALKPGGLFISFEPTHDNWLWRRVRQRIYRSNDLFDADTEQGFEYRDLEGHFASAGFRKVDEVFPGLLAYVLYYNPDAFPWLNVGGATLARAAFAVDRLLWANWIGRKMSFATLGIWVRE